MRSETELSQVNSRGCRKRSPPQKKKINNFIAGRPKVALLVLVLW